MPDRIARVWNGTSWEIITSTAAAPTAVATYQSASPSNPVTGQVWVDSDDNTQYVYTGSTWTLISGGGATGGGSNKVFYENDQTVTSNYTISTSKNAVSAGPITINNGVTVTVPSNSVWVII